MNWRVRTLGLIELTGPAPISRDKIILQQLLICQAACSLFASENDQDFTPYEAQVGLLQELKDNIPTGIVVEPDSAACVMESIKTGKIEKIDIKRESLMGGMSCGEVSLVPWEILKNSVKHCISLPDDDIAKTMKLLGNASFSEESIIAGENAAPGVISLIASCEDETIKTKIDLNENSNVLIFGCEGDTDQEMYQKLVNQK